MKTTKIIDNNADREVFNEKAIHPLQSWEWGEAREKMGIKILRLGEYEGDILKQVYTITYHKIPNTFFTIGYLPRSFFLSEETMQIIKGESKKRRAIFVKFEPNIYSEQSDNISESKDIKIYHDILKKYTIRSSHALFPEWTQILHINQPEDVILQKMKSKTRYNVHLAQKKGIVVKEMTNDIGYKQFISLYFKTTKRQNYRGHNYAYHAIIYKTLKEKISHILIAYLKDEPLAAYQLFIFNDIAYYPYGGSSEKHKNLMASNLLMWEAIKFGKKMGCKIFDMWGSLPPNYDRSASWSGFTRFKEGYGTEFAKFIGSYDMVLNPLVYNIYSVLYKIRKRIL